MDGRERAAHGTVHGDGITCSTFPNRFCDLGRAMPVSSASCLASLGTPPCWQMPITVNCLQPACNKLKESQGPVGSPTLPAALQLVRHELTSTKAFRVQQQWPRSKRLDKISPCVAEVAVSHPAHWDTAGLSQETARLQTVSLPSRDAPGGFGAARTWHCPPCIQVRGAVMAHSQLEPFLPTASSLSHGSLEALTWAQVQPYPLWAHLGGDGAA